MNIQWNADKYTKDFSYVHQYGADVMDLLVLEKNMRILDLGCGNGTLTKQLSDKGLQAVGMDASEDMLKIAKQQYPELTFLIGNAVNFSVEQPFDAVFSNAVFHWIDMKLHPSMLKSVNKALKPKGQFVFEFGGHGNCMQIHKAMSAGFEKIGIVYNMNFCFPTIGEYAPLLEQAGFKIEYASLFDRPTELKGENGLEDWINMFLKFELSKIADKETRAEVIKSAIKSLRADLYAHGKWYADYVRIRMRAVKHE